MALTQTQRNQAQNILNGTVTHNGNLGQKVFMNF
jgi:hypothetical protein